MLNPSKILVITTQQSVVIVLCAERKLGRKGCTSGGSRKQHRIWRCESAFLFCRDRETKKKKRTKKKQQKKKGEREERHRSH